MSEHVFHVNNYPLSNTNIFVDGRLGVKGLSPRRSDIHTQWS